MLKNFFNRSEHKNFQSYTTAQYRRSTLPHGIFEFGVRWKKRWPGRGMISTNFPAPS